MCFLLHSQRCIFGEYLCSVFTLLLLLLMMMIDVCAAGGGDDDDNHSWPYLFKCQMTLFYAGKCRWCSTRRARTFS